MDDRLYQLQADYIKALGHPTRIKILEHMREQERCVCKFTENLGLEQSNVSQHLAILRRQNIVSCRKEGMNMIYWISDPKVFEVLDAVGEILLSHVTQTINLMEKKEK